MKELRLSVSKGGGEEGGWLNLLVVRKSSKAQKKYPIQQGETAQQFPNMHSIHPLCIAESFRKTGSHTGC